MTDPTLDELLRADLQVAVDAMTRATATAQLLGMALPPQCQWVCWELPLWTRTQLGSTLAPTGYRPAGGDDPMHRRVFLAIAATLGGAALVEELERVDAAAPHAPPQAAVTLADTLAWYRARTETLPAADLYRGLARLAAATRELARHAADAGVLAGLRATAAEADARAGWVAAYDLANPQSAAWHLGSALQAAVATGDGALHGWTLGMAASVANCQRRARDAQALATDGARRARRAASTTVRAYCLAEAGMAAGNARQERDALSLLDAARAQRAEQAAGPEPAYLHLDVARLDGRLALLYRWFGQHELAAELLEGALRHRPAGDGHRAVLLADLAGALLDKPSPDVDRACDLAAQSLAIGVQLGSYLRTRRVTDLLGPLEAWKDHQSVKELREQLAAATPIPA